jgi:hypothetical protein
VETCGRPLLAEKIEPVICSELRRTKNSASVFFMGALPFVAISHLVLSGIASMALAIAVRSVVNQDSSVELRLVASSGVLKR